MLLLSLLLYLSHICLGENALKHSNNMQTSVYCYDEYLWYPWILGIFNRFCKQIPVQKMKHFCTDTYVLDPLKKVTIFLSFLYFISPKRRTYIFNITRYIQHNCGIREISEYSETDEYWSMITEKQSILQHFDR